MNIETVRAAVEAVMRSGQVPGMAVAVARGDQPVEYLALGTDATGEPIRRETLFPVASVTKMATALAVLRLADQGLLALDDELDVHLPRAVAAVPGVTLRALLCHTSGLPIDVAPAAAPYAHGLDWATLATACLLTPLEAKPGTRVRYSNVGYGLLAQVVEHRTGAAFSAALRDLVLEPLRIEGSLGDEPARRPAVVADVHGRHRRTDLEPFNSAFYRSLALPWAGLVTNVDGALAIVRAFASRPADFLRDETRAQAARSNTGELAGGFVPPLMWPRCPWGLGPEVRGDKMPHWVPIAAGTDSFGHSGMSGALAWYAPARNVAWAMLGARAADGGWLLRRGAAICTAILAE